MNVLYLHPAATFGGASKSLIELYKPLSELGVIGTVLTPRGSAEKAFVQAGFNVKACWGLSQFDGTQYGHYRGFRWLILLRELAFFPSSILSIFQLRTQKFDIIHVNEITLLPIAIIAKLLLKLPMVVHVRSVQCLPTYNYRARLINYLLKRFADVVVAIDHCVANTVDKKLNVRIIHNGLAVIDADLTFIEKNKNRRVRVGFMGVLIKLKGVYELLEALIILKKSGVEVECLIVGENARNLRGIRAWLLNLFGFYSDVYADLRELIVKNNIEDRVKLLGFVSDVHQIYSSIDILCFPSYLDAAGRPVFEAAFYSVPSIVAINNPLPDAVLHEVTGLAIPRPEPILIANAIKRLVEDELFRLQMGAAAKEWAVENFSINAAALNMLKVYNSLLIENSEKGT